MIAVSISPFRVHNTVKAGVESGDLPPTALRRPNFWERLHAIIVLIKPNQETRRRA